jgi:prevent-host-death family protein
MSINIHSAKTNLSRLIDEVEAGAEITIARAGKPVAKLVPLDYGLPPRRLGILAGAFTVPDDFDAIIPEIADSFESS